MISLLKKELNSFFGSLIGYIAIIAFLTTCGLFLWVFPGNYNISVNGYASLDGFFTLAPWLYLFLVPALTMRLFAEEKRQGTIETLLTRPISDFKLVAAKFLAGFILVVFSLLPTLLYFLSVYLLGNPPGNIDTGATWGAFIGLFFLAAIYVAIGLFASSITGNQVVSFIVAMALSFIFYLGFEFVGSVGIPYLFENGITWLSINEHYLSISRGIIDLRDIAYFVGMVFLFLIFTKYTIRPKSALTFRKVLKKSGLPVLVLFLMLMSLNFLVRIDLTADQRYSLSPVSKEILKELQKDVEIEFFLEGELQPGLKRLQDAVIEKVVDMNSYSSRHFRMRITDPYAIINHDKREAFFKELVAKGIRPTDFRQNTEQGVVTKLVFPGALLSYNGKEVAVNFLKNNLGFSGETNLNHSIENIEFELTDAFRKLMLVGKPVMAFLDGQGELSRYEVGDICNSLADEFNFARITNNDLLVNPGNFHILVIAGPTQPFTEADKFAIDQYIMKGGKVMWLVDPVQVSLDSLQSGLMTIAFPINLNINDQLFRYGVRLNPDLIQDEACSRIRVNTAVLGNPPEFTLHPWYYSPLLVPNDGHEIGRNLNQVMAEFVSSIDTINVPGIKKSVILTTSPYSRKVKTPASVSLELINMPPDKRVLNEKFIPTGVLLEGSFTSVFKNRMVSQFNPSGDYISESQPTKMIVLSDASIIANMVDYSSGKPTIQPLGYDRVSKYTFGNKEFVMNAIYYLDDTKGIMQLRNRTVKLRLLDKVKLREEIRFWQWLNILIPVFAVSVFGVAYNAIRRRRFGR